MRTEFWHWLDTGAHDAAMNMAIDEALLQTANDRAVPLLRTYQWTRSAVSIGYFMEYPEQFESSHEIVRRSTGGGLVFHGHDLTFTFIAPRDHEFYKLCVCDSYRRLHGLIAQALARIGIACAMQESAAPVVAENVSFQRGHGRLTSSATVQEACFELAVPHDIVLDDKKICGGAQRRTRDGLLHQGSLLLPRSVRRPVAQLKDALRNHMGPSWREMTLSASDMGRAEAIRRSKYATEAWNRKRARSSARHG